MYLRFSTIYVIVIKTRERRRFGEEGKTPAYRGGKTGKERKRPGMAFHDFLSGCIHCNVCALWYAIRAFWRWLTHFRAFRKKVKKLLKNLLTKANGFDIITKLSTKAAADRTLKIEQHSRRTRRIKPLYSFE